MTAPAQIIRSASISVDGSRVPRTPSDDTQEMLTSEDDSSHSASAENGASEGHSSFGAILSQYFTPPSSGARSSQSDRVQTGQQKTDNVDSNRAAGSVQPSAKAPISRSEANSSDSFSTSLKTAVLASRTLAGIPSSPDHSSLGPGHSGRVQADRFEVAGFSARTPSTVPAPDHSSLSRVQSGRVQTRHQETSRTLPETPNSLSAVGHSGFNSDLPEVAVAGLPARTPPAIPDSPSTTTAPRAAFRIVPT